MLLTNLFSIILVTFGALSGRVYGQNDKDCDPFGIHLFVLAGNGTLWWQMDPFGECNITGFLVEIYGNNEHDYHYNVTDSYLDLSFLELCLKWRFTIAPISQRVIKRENLTMEAYFPFPPDEGTNFTVSSWNVNETEYGVIVSWDVENGPVCALEYQVSTYDEKLGQVSRMHLEEKYINLTNLAPCASYTVQVQPINAAVSGQTGPTSVFNFDVSARPQIAPILNTIDIYPTSVNTSWMLEGDSNRCPLTAFHVNSSYFNQTIPLEGSENLKTVAVVTDSLLPNKMYFFQVSVENTAGISAISQIAVQTLEN